MTPQVTKAGLSGMQVCVPEEWTDEQAESFANERNPAGGHFRWRIRKEGHPMLQGDPERAKCDKRVGFVHIMLEC